ncbi:transcriptional regulator, TetR family [Parafrankia sp. EAN1pec]|uniref:TetR/AcrR family transcriptional regulator n=1 Tax=Parafrankia sp. (strain EAN1pec) TaxID=298653 RepID=UPI0000541779|nr:transcriptional regulator, TetR family [Frankia sp. EAN1pec]
MPVVIPSTKEQIVRAAERLFAAHGLDGISLRQIGAAAGNGNNSAVQYHFGSRDQLVQAIFEYRLPWLHERRTLLIAEHRPDDLRSLLDCQVRTLLEHSELPGSHYLCFVDMLRQYGRRDVFEGLPAALRDSAREFQERLGGFLPHLVEPLRARRVAQAMAFIVDAAADRERAHTHGRPVVPFALQVTDLLDGMVGFLKAPASPRTLAVLERTDPAAAVWPAFL